MSTTTPVPTGAAKRSRWGDDGRGNEVRVIRVPLEQLDFIRKSCTQVTQRTGSEIEIENPVGHYEQQQQRPRTAEIVIRRGNVEEARLLIQRLASGVYLRTPFSGFEAKNLPLLYVDILNYVDSHFFRDRDDWAIEPVLRRMREFVDAAKASGTELIVFIDAVRTGEALDKWKSRMTRAVMEGKRNVPQNISGVMAELCLRAGVKQVRLSTVVNNDDTLAAYSSHDNVPILSGDKDYYRYVHRADGRPARLNLFNDFSVISGRLWLSRRPMPHSVAQQERLVLVEPPPAFSVHGVDEDVWVLNLNGLRAFRGGAPSPLVKTLGFNPYLRIRPLRVALYRELLKGSLEPPIREEFPVYDINQKVVVFPVDDIDLRAEDGDGRSHDSLVELLKHPRRAYEEFFPEEYRTRRCPLAQVDDGDWYRHCHGCKVIVIEICCYLPSNKQAGMNFLDVLLDSEKWLASEA